MDKTEKTREVAIERGTVVEKQIAAGGYWYQYRVESLTRKGVKSRWMESVDLWEHVQLSNGDGGDGYPIGTEVDYAMFADGRGVILNRMEATKADYDKRVKGWTDFMQEVREAHQTIINKLDALSTQLTNAQTSIEGKVASAQSSIEGKVADAQSSIEGKVGETKTQVTTSEGVITGAVEAAKNEILGAL